MESVGERDGVFDHAQERGDVLTGEFDGEHGRVVVSPPLVQFGPRRHERPHRVLHRRVFGAVFGFLGRSGLLRGGGVDAGEGVGDMIRPGLCRGFRPARQHEQSGRVRDRCLHRRIHILA